ncbi:UNVERIFIED_CONTAM: hypothetical protein PYX00_008066 [Menopon gallinae]|uniref:Neurite outgrowth-associated protein n=1 Tax=Menopon gallinae TaxID=328185 RepID=A0AAW2HMY2_9NEOP
MIFMKCMLSSTRAVALYLSRNIQTSPVVSVQLSSILLRRGRKHSDFPEEFEELETDDFVEDGERIEPNEGFLENAYRLRASEEKEKRRIRRRISLERKYGEKRLEPNMLTWSEAMHMKFLHESNPEEWSVERLSESFPVLPEVVPKILKRRWKPETELRLRERDAIVLENWEKFKRGELEASPRLLEHLKKFIDKRENLKAQLKNDKFFYLEDVKEKKKNWKPGPLSSILTTYERQIENLHKGKQNLLPGGSGKSLAVKDSEALLPNEIEEAIPIPSGTKGKDSVLIPGKKSSEKPMTLDEMKRNVFEKTERKEKLSRFDKVVLDKTLEAGTRHPQKPRAEVEEKERKSRRREGRKNSLPEDDEEMMIKYTSRPERMAMTKREEEYFSYINRDVISEKDVGKYLEIVKSKSNETQTADTTPKEEVPEKQTKEVERVKYFNTEKDKQVVAEQLADLSETCFFGKRANRKRSVDAGINPSPHLAGEMSTFFTYDYPEKITIPKEQRIKGKTYRVKDCYYDDDGTFLYRVPGMARD